MRTTINSVDRRGDAHEIERLEAVLVDARRLLADMRAMLDLEIEALNNETLDATGQDRLKNLKTMLLDAQRTTRMVIDFEAKLCVHSLGLGKPIDLEAARGELLSRFARYVT